LRVQVGRANDRNLVPARARCITIACLTITNGSLEHPRPRTAATLTFFALRHGVASVAVIAGACVIWTISYVALIVWAIVTNKDLGGALTYPAGLLVVVLAAGAGTLVLFFPATALAEWVCRRKRLPIVAQIPVSLAFLALLSALAGGVIQALRQPLAGSVLRLGVWLFVLSLIPIGAYWWIAQAGPLLRAAFGRFLRARVEGAWIYRR
jgi:hypothetical protein